MPLSKEFVLYITISLSLVFIGSYTTALFFQLFLTTFFINNLTIKDTIVFPLVLFSLSKIFISTNYILYFLNISIFLYKTNTNSKKLLLITLEMVLVVFAYLYSQNTIYELYIVLDINDKEREVFYDVFILINLFQIMVLWYERWISEII